MIQPVPTIRQAVIIGGSQRPFQVPPAGAVEVGAPQVVASVTVSPSSFSVIEGLQVQFLVATPRDSGGVIIGGKTATWASSNEAVATATATGGTNATVTAVSAGTTTITATIDGVAGTSAATVLATAATVTVSPSSFSLQASQARAVDAQVLDSGGAALPDRDINWSSNNIAVASVAGGADYTATVQAVALGTATITATVEGASGTATATVVAASSNHPNEPAGYARIYENAYTVLPPPSGAGYSTVGTIAGCWSTGFGLVPVIRTDPTTPSGDGVVYGIKVGQGTVSGFGPGVTREWDTCAPSGSPYSKVYHDIRIKLAGGPGGDLSTWHFDASLTKILGFFGVAGAGGGGFETYGFTFSNGISSSARISWDVAIPNSPRILNPNVGEQNLIVGQWHRVEIVMELASTPTASDGVFKLWVDATQTMNYTNVKWQDAGNTTGFYQRHNSPTWGGIDGPNKSRDDWIYYDDVYISGIP